MSQPTISTDENLDAVCQLFYYQPTGFHSNSRTLHRDLKNRGYRFCLRDVRDWLQNQNEWQKNAPSPKDTPRVSYGKIQKPNCVHQCDILFLTHDKYKGKTWKAVLQIIDISSRYKASAPLISKKSSEVAKAFRRIYDDPSNPLTYPTLLQCDGGREFMGETARLMEAHNVTIRVIGTYSHRGTAIVERFNKTLTKMLYNIQYAVEQIDSKSRLVRAWVNHLPKVIDYLNNYPTRLIRAPGSSKWGLAPKEAIRLERVESRPSTKYKRPVGKNEIKLKKGDTVRYLLANAEWEGGFENQRRTTDPVWSPTLLKNRKIVVTKNEPVLYYLEGDEFTPKRGFVREELMHVNIDTLQYPPQSILEENTRSRSVHFIRPSNKLAKAQQYAEK